MVATALHLFEGPYVVVDGRRRNVPEGGKRVLVMVALADARVERNAAASTLWPTGRDGRAAGNLRSALWRLRMSGIDIIDADRTALHLAAGTLVDLHVLSERATRLISGRPLGDDLDLRAWRHCSKELLPGWYDDWVVFERERLRQRLLHGLEALSRHLVRVGRCAEAIEAALTVVGVDPFRESAQRVLIETHLREGNIREAYRAYELYREMIARELGVLPSPEIIALIASGARSSSRARRTVWERGQARG